MNKAPPKEPATAPKRPKTPAEFCKHWRVSRNTYERMHLRGDGPRRTYLTPSKHVITPEAEAEWAASRIEPRA